MRTPVRQARTQLLGIGAAAVLAVWGLTACGSATVEDTGEGNEQTGTETSVAPLDRGDGSEEATSSSAAEPNPGGGAAAQDEGAHEVDEVPEPKDRFTGNDRDYLDFVQDKDVDTKGVESEIIAAASTVCDEDSVTLPAVAGQLIEQDRTDLQHDELVKLLTDKAEKTYC